MNLAPVTFLLATAPLMLPLPERITSALAPRQIVLLLLATIRSLSVTMLKRPPTIALLWATAQTAYLHALLLWEVQILPALALPQLLVLLMLLLLAVHKAQMPAPLQ